MLFITPKEYKKGLGKSLIQYAINNFSVNEVTVNEQNQNEKFFMSIVINYDLKRRIYGKFKVYRY